MEFKIEVHKRDSEGSFDPPPPEDTEIVIWVKAVDWPILVSTVNGFDSRGFYDDHDHGYKLTDIVAWARLPTKEEIQS